MSSRSYSGDAVPDHSNLRSRPGLQEPRATAEQEVKVTASTPPSTTSTSTTSTTTRLPKQTQDTSMEALSGSGYIVSVVLVLVVGALVGVLATLTHHLHHRRLLLHQPAILHHLRQYRHHHRHEELPASSSSSSSLSHQRRLLLQDHHRHSATPMLSIGSGMEVGNGGHGGLSGPTAGSVGAPAPGGGGGGAGGAGGVAGTAAVAASGMQKTMLAAARDRAIRTGSVRQDLALDLPPRLQLPDGEERPYGAHMALHLRDPEQESEIYQKCVRPPPNRTVFDSESPPPYRSQSALLDPPERIVRCHSAGSALLRVFRKFPSPDSSSTGSTSTTATTMTGLTSCGPAPVPVPAVVVPATGLATATATGTAPGRRPTLSSYSESSGNLSQLSSLTVVPCEADDSHQQRV